jgi:predicted outer membrane repeat protein
VTHDVFQTNTAGTDGGGLYNDGTVTIASTQITQNTAGNTGGGIYDDGSTTLSSSSSVYANHPNNCAPLGSVTGCFG